jgi:hypothetical protein
MRVREQGFIQLIEKDSGVFVVLNWTLIEPHLKNFLDFFGHQEDRFLWARLGLRLCCIAGLYRRGCNESWTFRR